MAIFDSLPLLSTGSHPRGSGKACIMNAISYLNGDAVITDFPSCTDYALSIAAQLLNDTICSHRKGSVLCSDCSHRMWLLGERIIGTTSATEGWTSAQKIELYTKLAGRANKRAGGGTYSLALAAYDSALNMAIATFDTDVNYAAQTAAAVSVYTADRAESLEAFIDDFYELTGYTVQRELRERDAALVAEQAKISC